MKITFTTRIYPKYYDEDKIWIDATHVGSFSVSANSVKEAEKKYFEYLDSHGYEISANARRKYNIGEGYDAQDHVYKIYTAKTLIVDRSADYCRHHYVEVWAQAKKVEEEFLYD